MPLSVAVGKKALKQATNVWWHSSRIARPMRLYSEQSPSKWWRSRRMRISSARTSPTHSASRMFSLCVGLLDAACPACTDSMVDSV